MNEQPIQTGASLAQRYEDLNRRIRQAAMRAGREQDTIHLVAVTKFAEIDDIKELIALGHRDFGENRVQQLVQRAAVFDELLARRKAMPETSAESNTSGLNPASPPRWHMIGHLQRNKVAKVVPHVRLIHSIDSLRLLEELQAYARNRDLDIEVLVQVNCSGEPQKYGCAVPAAEHLCEQIDLSGNVHIRGLMTIAPLTDDPALVNAAFARCGELYEDISKLDLGDGRFNILSMGMTSDFELAIEHGANVLRVGSALFPPRPLDDDEAD